MIHPATRFQFERIVQDYSRWQAVDEENRSRAPAWWWGPALALRDERQPMPSDWCKVFGLPPDASFADAAHLMLDGMADETAMPWPEEFPRRYQPPVPS